MRNPWKLTALALAGLLAIQHTPLVAADAQPKMHAALESLRSAERSLEQAAHDKGGHRKKALELTQAAIVEVKAGIKHDNRN